MSQLRSMLVVFPEIKIGKNILKFRSFVNHQISHSDNLFHNHATERNSVIYRYPLIQYRSHNGMAAMFGIEDGYNSLNDLLENHLDMFPPKFQTFERKENRTKLELIAGSRTYQLHDWLGLNTTRNKDKSLLVREKIFEELNTLEEKREMIRAILQSQLLAFCREMGVELPLGQLWTKILDFKSTGKHAIVSQTGTSYFTGFQIQYQTNLNLPNYIAFGKAVSKGFGWQKQIL